MKSDELDSLSLKGTGFVHVNGIIIPMSNDIVTQGRNKLLDTMFRSSTPEATWYWGLINNSPTPTPLATDTLAVIGVSWAEFTSYSGTRKSWSTNASASGNLTTNTLPQFDITAGATLYGAFLCSSSALANDSGEILWNVIAFDDPLVVTNGTTLKLDYTLQTV